MTWFTLSGTGGYRLPQNIEGLLRSLLVVTYVFLYSVGQMCLYTCIYLEVVGQMPNSESSIMFLTMNIAAMQLSAQNLELRCKPGVAKVWDIWMKIYTYTQIHRCIEI